VVVKIIILLFLVPMQDMQIFKDRNFGFTLVELLVAISIMATLMMVLLPNLMGSRQKARDARKIQDLESVKNALRLYYNDNQNYPEGDGISDLTSELADYLPAVSGVGFTYYQTGAGDGFNLCVGLEMASGDADVESQTSCGVVPGVSGSVCGLGVGITADGIFAVCTN